MLIDEEKLKREYGSIQEFLRVENIAEGVYYALKRKTTSSFQRRKGEKSWSAFKKLEKLKLLKEEICN